MKKINLFILSFLLFAQFALAQKGLKGTVEGVVTDAKSGAR